MPPRGLTDQSPTLTAPSPVQDGTAVTTPSPNGNGPASAKVQVHLLGTPTVTLGDRSLSISRRKVRALFFRLAAASEPVPREHLSFLFWPDMREATARRNLTGLLSHLRRALPDPDLLVAGDDHVWLESALFWSDALALEALQADQTQSPAHVCQRVVDLYRGSFLAGFSLSDSPEFESWVTLERSNWEQRYLASLGTLVERASGTGEYEVAVNLAHRYLEADDLAEDVHRRLIEIYAAMGDRHEAVRQYERCVEILERELGVEPLPETEAVYRAAVDGTLVSVVAQAEPLWTAVPSLDLPLVERDGLLSELEMAFSRVRSGHGAVVLLSGESGIGKTRLIQEFARRLEGRANLLAGSAYPHGQAIPYQPLVDALRPALSNNPSWMEVAACCFDELELLMPDLHALHGRLTHRPRAQPNTSGEAGRTRTRLFEALCQLILGMATGPHPLVLFLDDLHWADGTTLDWLAFLGRRLRGVPLLVVGTYNSEESGQVAGLRQSLARERILSEFELWRLERESILAILGSLEQLVPADDSLADLLQQATGGNPFYLFETIQALVESACDIDELGGMASFCLPDAIREAVEGRTARLSARTHQVLEAGAVLGPLFTFDQVHMTAGRQEMETMDGLDELVARQFLLEEDSEYRFRHEVIRAAVYRALGSGRRRLLHRRAGETLERLRTGDEPAMARHFDRAGEAGRAAFHSLEAGREAKAVFGHEEARRHFDRALVLLDQQAATLRRPEAVAASQDLRIEALFERGWVLRLLGEMEAYAADLEEEARLAERLGDPSTLAHLRYRQAYAHRWFCRYEQALAAAEDGLRLSREADNPLHKALCTREIGMVARETGDYDRAQAALDEARGALAGLGETVLHLHTIGSLSTLSLQQGNYQRGIDLARQALAICDRAGLPYERRLPLGDMGAAAGALGQAGQAQEALEQSLKIARQISDETRRSSVSATSAGCRSGSDRPNRRCSPWAMDWPWLRASALVPSRAGFKPGSRRPTSSLVGTTRPKSTPGWRGSWRWPPVALRTGTAPWRSWVAWTRAASAETLEASLAVQCPPGIDAVGQGPASPTRLPRRQRLRRLPCTQSVHTLGLHCATEVNAAQPSRAAATQPFLSEPFGLWKGACTMYSTWVSAEAEIAERAEERWREAERDRLIATARKARSASGSPVARRLAAGWNRSIDLARRSANTVLAWFAGQEDPEAECCL